MTEFEKVAFDMFGECKAIIPKTLSEEEKNAIKRALFLRFEQGKDPFLHLLQYLEVINLYPVR